MIEAFVMGLFFGGLAVYLFIMSIPTPQIDWRETILTKLNCYDCDKIVAPVEFTLHGGLCEDCYKERHGYNYRTSEPKAKKEKSGIMKCPKTGVDCVPSISMIVCKEKCPYHQSSVSKEDNEKYVDMAKSSEERRREHRGASEDEC